MYSLEGGRARIVPRQPVHPSWKILLIALVLPLLAGCADKAKAIQTAAAQFTVQSKAALTKMDEFRQAELAPLPVPDGKSFRKGVGYIASLKKVNASDLDFALDPLRLNASPDDTKWQAFLSKINNQYTEFQSVFRNLDKGSLLAAGNVEEAVPPLKKLIGQLAAFAKSFETYRVKFVKQRADLAADMEHILEDTNNGPELKEALIKEKVTLLYDIAKQEKAMERDVLEATAVALKTGQELKTLLETYDDATVDDIVQGLNTALDFAGQVLGREISSLKQNINDEIGALRADADISRLIDEALEQAKDARKPD